MDNWDFSCQEVKTITLSRKEQKKKISFCVLTDELGGVHES